MQIKGLRRPHPRNWLTTQVAPESPKTFGQHLLKRRLAAGLLQRELAHRFGVHLETLKNWEHDRYLPDLAKRSLVLNFVGPLPAELERVTAPPIP
ncbi:MAG TPA: helix-turn-helix transcriptional regulator [Verrucomicrobiota bacterium]|nr:helix-turn-helix transcriptional regulator [Verrucomicrobiota bacterium]